MYKFLSTLLLLLGCEGFLGALLTTSEIASMEGDLSLLIQGRIHPLSGAYCEVTQDAVVPSVFPLVLTRSYHTPTYTGGNRNEFWQLNIADSAFMHAPKDETFSAYFFEKHGTKHLFYLSKEETVGRAQSLEARGFTNLGGGYPSGKTHPRNYELERGANNKKLYVRRGDGSSSILDCKWEKDHHTFNYYKLERENHPNGAFHLLQKIDSGVLILERYSYGAFSKTGRPMGEILFDELRRQEFKSQQDPRLVVRTSTGQEIIYMYKKHKWNQARKKDHWYGMITKVIAPHQNYREFVYEEPGKKHKQRLVKIKHDPEGTTGIEFEYYTPGSPHNGCAHFATKPVEVATGSWLDSRLLRTKEPLGTFGEFHEAYCFNYFSNNLKGEAERLYTEVFDPHSNKDVFEYTTQFRPISVKCFSGGLDGEIRYVFGPQGTPDAINLTAQTIEDKKGLNWKSVFYTYDARGNVIYERLYGPLAGDLEAKPVIADGGSYIAPPKALFDEKYCTYTDDGFNNKLTERHQDGYGHKFGYLPYSSLKTFEYLTVGENIVQRHFWDYNNDNLLTQEIIDDGTTPHKDDLTGATYRLIIQYTPTLEPVNYGFPKEIREYGVNLATGEKVLQKTTKRVYSNQGKVTSEKIFDGEGVLKISTEKHYDIKGNLTKETKPSGEWIYYTYDAHSNLIQQEGPFLGHVKKMSYDKMHRCVKEEEIFPTGERFVTQNSYNFLSQKYQVVDPQGRLKRVNYDRYGNIIEVIHPAVLDEQGVGINYREKKVADFFGNVIETIHPDGVKVRQTYNCRGSPVKTYYQDGTVEEHLYNANGTKASSRTTEGVKTLYRYDGQRRVIAEDVFSINGEPLGTTTFHYQGDHLVSTVNAEGHETLYTYDLFNRLQFMIEGEVKKEFLYDSLGRECGVCHFEGDKVLLKDCKELDACNRISRSWKEDGEGVIYDEHDYQYDALDHCILDVSQDRIYSYVYDPHGHLLEEVDPEGNKTLYLYDYECSNSLGQKALEKTKIDPKGRRTVELFDAMGRLEEVRKESPLGKLLAKSRFLYTWDGKKKEERHTLFYEEKTEEQVLRYSYDSRGHLIELREAVGTTLERATRYHYNALGQKEGMVKSDGTLIHYAYDAKGRLARLFDERGTVDDHYTYDKLGQIIEVTDQVRGLVTKRSYTRHGKVASETLATGFTFDYSYTPLGQIASISLPDKSHIDYDYNGAFLTKVEKKDSFGTLLFTHKFTEYDAWGQLIEEELIDGTYKRYSYDRLHRLTEISHPARGFEEMTYDEVGQLVHLVTKDPQKREEKFYSYDDLGQLVKESGAFQEDYSYDSLANRRSKNGTLYEVNGLNQILFDGETKYTYDQNGNLLEKSSPTQTTLYSYDSLDRLIEVKEGTSITSYLYDSFHRRLSKSQDQLRRYLYLMENEIGEVSEEGEVVSLRTLGLGRGAEIGASVAIQLGSILYTPHHDPSGHLVDLCTKTFQQSYRYTTFGEDRTENVQLVSPWGFSSKRYDPETGYVYFGRRYYAPALGRFLTPDPLSYASHPNLYQYVSNAPLTRFDLYGLVDETAFQYSCRHQGTDWEDARQEQQRQESCYYRHPAKNHFYSLVETNGETGLYLFWKGDKTDSEYPVYFSNGIMNDFSTFKKSMSKAIDRNGGDPVYGRYNPTHAKGGTVRQGLGFLADIFRAVCGRLGYESPVSDMMRTDLRYLMSMDKYRDKQVLVLAHSEGNIVADNCFTYLPKEYRDRIQVLSVAPAKHIDRRKVNKIQTFISMDIVPLTDPIGLIRNWDVITYLPPAGGDEMTHSFTSPTYDKIMKKEIELYKSKNKAVK